MILMTSGQMCLHHFSQCWMEGYRELLCKYHSKDKLQIRKSPPEMMFLPVWLTKCQTVWKWHEQHQTAYPLPIWRMEMRVRSPDVNSILVGAWWWRKRDGKREEAKETKRVKECERERWGECTSYQGLGGQRGKRECSDLPDMPAYLNAPPI